MPARIQKGLQLGDVIQCKVCGDEHTTKGTHSSDVDAVKKMLYVFCPKPKPGNYYVGSIGSESNRGPIAKNRIEKP